MFLKELELINFMCYDHLKITLDEHITVIYGQNGSGKSALLSAINLIFGGLARERQDLLRNFIKHGREYAIIRARISNAIPLPGRGLVVLDNGAPLNSDIVIERIITHEDSSYKLNGKKTTREKLTELLLKVNISSKNTFYFIPQEKITKLVDLKPEERLDSLLTSLGLYDLKDSIEKLRLKLREHIEKKKELESKVGELKEKIEGYKKTLKSTEESLKTLKNFYRLKVSQLFKKLNMTEEDEKKLKQAMDEIGARIRDNTAFIENVPKNLEKLDLEAENLRNRRVEITKRISELEEEERRLNDEIKALTNKLSSLSTRRDEMMKSFWDILNKWRAASIEDIKSLLEDKKMRLEDLEKAIDQLEEGRQIKELEKMIQRKRKELQEVESLEREYAVKLEEMLKEIDPSGEVLRLYNFIQRSNLTNECFGPIILELDFLVPQDKLIDYSKALERILREDIMKSFVTTSLRSLKNILEFIKDRKILSPPNIFFFGHAHSVIYTDESFVFFLRRSIEWINEAYDRFKKEITRKLESIPEYRSSFLTLVPDILSAPRPVLALIRYFLGKVALVGRLETGLELLRELDLDGILTVEGDFVRKLRCGDYAIFQVLPPIKDRYSPVVDKVIQLSIKNIRDKKQELLEAIQRIKDEINTLEKELENLKINAPKRLKNMLEERIRLMENIEELENDTKFLEKIRKERESLPDQIQKIEKQLEEVDENLRRVVDEKHELEKELQNIDFEAVEIEHKKEFLIKEKSRLELENDDLKHKLTEIEVRLGLLRERKNSIISEIERLKKEMKALLSIVWASFYSDVGKNLEEILRDEIIDPAISLIESLDIHQIEELLSRYSEQDISRLRFDILSREEKVRLLEESLKQLEIYQKELQRIESEIESARKLAEESLRKLVDELHEKVDLLNKNYRYILSKIGASGDIKIEGRALDNLSLSITIDLHRRQPVEISQGAFSSGEKTLAIFAFLMALFLTAPAPILMLDEFDVYLDEATAKKVSRLLREAIKDMKSIQAIITTTHRLSLIEIADKILRLMYDDKRKTSCVHEIDKRFLEGIVKGRYNVSVSG